MILRQFGMRAAAVLLGATLSLYGQDARVGRANAAMSTTLNGDITLSNSPTWVNGVGTIANSLACVNNQGQVTSCATWSGGHPVRQPAHKVSVVQVDNSARLLTVADMAPVSYIELAKSIDMDSPSTDEAKLLAAIKSAGLQVYEFEKVDDYLLGKAAAQGPNVQWVWKPMRNKDDNALMNRSSGYIQGAGYIYRSVYGHKVPQKVLLDAKAILETMPSATFFVTDYEAINPDPFLAVTTPGLLAAGKLWIIDRWDEPGFGVEMSTLAGR